MSRLDSIARYREQSLDRAALIAALALARVDEHELEALAERQDEQLQDLLHDFAFRARKLIELAKREGLAAAEIAHKSNVACSPQRGTDDDLDIVFMSVWDLLGRIIHSDRFEIERGHVPSPAGDESAGQAAWGFTVASDRDRHGNSHFVFIEFLLQQFLEFDAQLSRELARSADR